MTDEHRPVQRLRGLFVGLFALCGIGFLIALRPAAPSLPNSLSDPVSLAEIESLTRSLAWLTLLSLAFLLLRRAISGAGGGTPQPSSNANHSSPCTRSTDRASTRLNGSGAALVRVGHHEKPVLLVTGTKIPTRETGRVAPPSPAGEQDASAQTESKVIDNVAISILGPLRIENGATGRPKLRASAGELIAYLALHPQGAGRDQLLDALWPGESPRRSEQRLWQATSQARKLLGDCLSRNRDHYQLARAKIRLDLDEFEHLLAQAQQAVDEPAERNLLERALELVHGEPLAGSDYLWADGHIRRLRATIIELLENLGRARLAAGDTRGALQAAEQGLTIDVLNESLWRLALQTEATLGHRQSVVDRYRTLTRILDEQLGLEPNRETRALYLTALAQL